MDFARYQPAHRARLESLARSPQWRAFLADPETLQRWKAVMAVPRAAPGQMRGAAEFLKARNAGRVQALIRSGVRDERALVHALGDWQTALADATDWDGSEPWPIFFLGLVLTIQCSFDPRRCLYCNQVMLPRRLDLEQWKALLAEAARPVPPYVYITGGEPLLLGQEVWGDDGLVAFATRLGCAVNVNTNAALITPRVALQLVKTGLAKVHVSLDSADPDVQATLFGGPERVEAVWRGLFNLQIAREALGADHPVIHINCVLTRLNLFQLPDLLRFLLDVRKIPAASAGRRITADPAFADFAFHLIPVGGSDNAAIRPTADEWKRFYTETWPEAEHVWAEYQAAIGVAESERRTLAAHVPFANPYRRADHRMSLDQYCQAAARGVYWQGALTERCYVAPTQAYVLPDGSQHWCGAHAVRRPPPLGSVRDATLRENVRRGQQRLAALPGPECVNCAGATCVINQSVERSLRSQVTTWLKAAAPAAS
ncbi:MAG: radical SAM protein [Chloroflexi bacterium]|nr:radical SAM protein [Chloroflexota bacterium]